MNDDELAALNDMGGQLDYAIDALAERDDALADLAALQQRIDDALALCDETNVGWHPQSPFVFAVRAALAGGGGIAVPAAGVVRDTPQRQAHTLELTDGVDTWKVICSECSAEAQDYVYPCQVGKWRKVPPHSLVGAPQPDEAILPLATGHHPTDVLRIAALGAERDAARAAVLGEVVAALEQSGQLQAAAFVQRMAQESTP